MGRGPDCRLDEIKIVLLIPPEKLLFNVHSGLNHCRGGEGFHAGLSLIVPPKCIEDFVQTFCYQSEVTDL